MMEMCRKIKKRNESVTCLERIFASSLLLLGRLVTVLGRAHQVCTALGSHEFW